MAEPVLVDDTLFDDVIGLLATLEQQRARAADRVADPVGLQSLTLIAAVTNALVGFVTARTSQTSVLPSRVLARLADTDPYTQMLGEENERITVATATGLLASWPGAEVDRQRMLDDLCRALLDVLGAYGEAVGALFHQPRLGDEWRAMFAVFVDDLRAAAQRMAA